MNIVRFIPHEMGDIIKVATLIEVICGVGFEEAVFLAGIALEYDRPRHGIWGNNT